MLWGLSSFLDVVAKLIIPSIPRCDIKEESATKWLDFSPSKMVGKEGINGGGQAGGRDQGRTLRQSTQILWLILPLLF